MWDLEFIFVISVQLWLSIIFKWTATGNVTCQVSLHVSGATTCWTPLWNTGPSLSGLWMWLQAKTATTRIQVWHFPFSWNNLDKRLGENWTKPTCHCLQRCGYPQKKITEVPVLSGQQQKKTELTQARETQKIEMHQSLQGVLQANLAPSLSWHKNTEKSLSQHITAFAVFEFWEAGQDLLLFCFVHLVLISSMFLHCIHWMLKKLKPLLKEMQANFGKKLLRIARPGHGVTPKKCYQSNFRVLLVSSSFVEMSYSHIQISASFLFSQPTGRNTLFNPFKK